MIDLRARPTSVIVGEETTLTICVTTHRPGPCSNVVIDLGVPHALALRRGARRLRLARLSPTVCHEHELRVRAMAPGTHEIAVTNLSYRDERGLSHRDRGVTIPVVAQTRADDTADRPGSVFISYRRTDAGRAARGLALALGLALPDRVFLDSTSLRPGDDFRRRLDRELSACSIVLPLIGPRWLTTLRARAADNVEDLVRHEVATALRRGVAVLPVLVGGASVPQRADLPDDVAALADQQAVRLETDDPRGRDPVVETVRRILDRWTP